MTAYFIKMPFPYLVLLDLIKEVAVRNMCGQTVN